MKTTGRVNGIISNIVIVKADGPVGQNEICHVYCGDTKMMAEVIKVVGDNAYVQVFDSTRGLKIGEKVEFEGHMLEATLAPGLLSRNYDGLQNDLDNRGNSVEVQVLLSAPNNENPNLFSIGEGFGFFVFFGKQNEGSIQLSYDRTY